MKRISARAAAGVLLALVSFGSTLTEKGPLAIKAPFNSRFTIEERPDAVALRIDVGKARAKVELAVAAAGDAKLSVGWSDDTTAQVPSMRSQFAQGSWNLVLKDTSRSDGLFEWPPGSALELRSSKAPPPQVLDWSVYTENNPSHSKAQAERDRTTLLVILGIAGLGFVGGMLIALFPETDKKAEPHESLETTLLRLIIGKVQNQADPKLAERGRAILTRMLIEGLDNAAAIDAEGDWVDGMKAFQWARVRFLTLAKATSDEVKLMFERSLGKFANTPAQPASNPSGPKG